MKKLILSYELAWRTKEDKKFIQSVEWKKIRKEILERDDFTCQYCETKRTTLMQINHIDGNPKDHSQENLEVICSSCHKILHSGLWAVVFGVLDVYEKSNYSQNDIIKITGKMRDEGKSDENIIKFLGLKNKITWKQDLDYLATKFGFIRSKKLNKSKIEVILSDEEQKKSLKNRDNW